MAFLDGCSYGVPRYLTMRLGFEELLDLKMSCDNQLPKLRGGSLRLGSSPRAENSFMHRLNWWGPICTRAASKWRGHMRSCRSISVAPISCRDPKY